MSNPNEPHHSASEPAQTGWYPAQPDKVPDPTLWPAAFALGSSFCLWGLVSSMIITWVGVGLFIISLLGWIRDIRHERKESNR